MFSAKYVESLAKSSFIRAMFEEGEKLRKQYGADNVFDFSIGNPEIEPPVRVTESIRRLAADDTRGMHRYMNNAGFADVREKVADFLSKKSGVPLAVSNIVMVTGAAAGLNVVLKGILNADEEVVCLSPFFVEYVSYIENGGGKAVIAKLLDGTFQPDIAAIEAVLTPKTKAIILNSPNNPTGVIFSKESLEALSALLEKKQAEFGTQIYVISDEPYVSIVYDGAVVPDMMAIFKNTIVVNSFSKSLALPGERIGYIAASSQIDDVSTLMSVLILLNRTLGFVNAPALFQRVIAENLDVTVDTSFYQARRDLLYNHLTSIGFSCVKPGGAFYLFPKTPIPDDVAFAKAAQKYNILVVPGSGFGCPGYVRMAYCIRMETIEGALPAFTKLAAEFGLSSTLVSG